MALGIRQLRLTFALGEGAFGESGANQVLIEGLRVRAKIIKAGGPSMGTANLQIYGLTFSLMNKLSTLGMMPTLIRRNTILIEAGKIGENAGFSTVFLGTITNAWADFASAPEAIFHVEAHTGLIEAVSSTPASSYTGPTTVQNILAGFASQLSIPFENNGVDVTLASPYFSGSIRDQILAVVTHAGIEWNGLDNGRLVIWPKGGSRGGLVPLVSPASGMVGYPGYTSMGIFVRTLFNPAIGFGGQIEVRSSLGPPTNGIWNVYALDYDLEALASHGQWFSSIYAVRPGLVVIR